MRRLIPTVAAMAVIGTPSATSKIILSRLASPAEMVDARRHASSVRCSAGVRLMVREVGRPRAIQRPCVIPGEIVTTWGSRHYPGKMCGKEDRDDSIVSRQTRCYRKKPYTVLDVPACPTRDVTVLDHTTGRVLLVSRPLEPREQ